MLVIIEIIFPGSCNHERRQKKVHIMIKPINFQFYWEFKIKNNKEMSKKSE